MGFAVLAVAVQPCMFLLPVLVSGERLTACFWCGILDGMFLNRR